jgi:RNA polymerase sigma factor (sigma-70 family)
LQVGRHYIDLIHALTPYNSKREQNIPADRGFIFQMTQHRFFAPAKSSNQVAQNKVGNTGNKPRQYRVSRYETADWLMGMHLGDNEKSRHFEKIALPHLDAAYNLARWLTRHDQDAEDLVQTAFLRAFKFIDGYRGGDARAWLLTIVRNTYFTSLRDGRHEQNDVGFDEEVHGLADGHGISVDGIGNNPETIMASGDVKSAINRALARLPQVFREVVVLKEMDDLSYKEIAEIAGIPIGTVMSRLARGRKLLLEYLKQNTDGK